MAFMRMAFGAEFWALKLVLIAGFRILRGYWACEIPKPSTIRFGFRILLGLGALGLGSASGP